MNSRRRCDARPRPLVAVDPRRTSPPPARRPRPALGPTTAGSCPRSPRRPRSRPGPSWRTAGRPRRASGAAARRRCGARRGRGRRTPAATRRVVGPVAARRRPQHRGPAGRVVADQRGQVAGVDRPRRRSPHSGHGSRSTQVQSLVSGSIGTPAIHQHRSNQHRPDPLEGGDKPGTMAGMEIRTAVADDVPGLQAIYDPHTRRQPLDVPHRAASLLRSGRPDLFRSPGDHVCRRCRGRPGARLRLRPPTYRPQAGLRRAPARRRSTSPTTRPAGASAGCCTTTCWAGCGRRRSHRVPGRGRRCRTTASEALHTASFGTSSTVRRGRWLVDPSRLPR